MNELFKKGKEFFADKANAAQMNLPAFRKLMKLRQQEKNAIHEMYGREKNQLHDEIQNLEGLIEQHLEYEEQLRQELKEANNIYGKPGHPKEDHDLSFIGCEVGDIPAYNHRMEDGMEEDFDVKNPVPRMKEVIGPYLRIDAKKIKKLLEKDSTEEAWNQFDNTRLGEAKAIEYSGLGHVSWRMSNRNRVEAEVEKRVPLTLYSEMEPKEVNKVTNIRILGENLNKDNDSNAYKPHIEYHPLPVNVNYALVKRYDFGRMKIEYYNENNELMNPSIEDNDLLIDEIEETNTWWQSIKNFFS